MITKICKKCNITQEYTNFIFIDIYKKEYIGRVCKECKSRCNKIHSNNKKSKQTNAYWKNYRRERMKIDPLFKFKDRVRSLLYNSIVVRKGYSKHTKSYSILGCDFDFFFLYIENQFKPGMNWDNIHLDHIKPLILGTTEEEVLKLNHYTNFQPLFIIDNLRKGSKY